MAYGHLYGSYQTAIGCGAPSSGAVGLRRPAIVDEVPRSLWVHESANGYFRRVGHAKHKLATDALARLFQQRGQARIIRFEEQEVPGAGAGDLDPLLVHRFAEAGQRDKLTQLRRLHLITEFDTRLLPTVSGVLLCTLSPQRWLSNAEISAVARDGLVNDPDGQVDSQEIHDH